MSANATGLELPELKKADLRRPYRQGVGTLPLAALRTSKESSRREARPDLLDELVASVRATGVIQPLIVRPVAGMPHQFEVVAGERRLKAAQLAGLSSVPAIIRELSDPEALAISLIENIQREELSAIDEARTLERLIAGFGLTHEEVARAVGKSRTTVSNLLRLLELPTAVTALMDAGRLSMGHARALLGLEEPAERERLAHLIDARQWSVRETEAQVRKASRGDSTARAGTYGRSRAAAGVAAREVTVAELSAPELSASESVGVELMRRRGLRAELHQRADGSGKIVIEFEDAWARDSVLQRLSTIDA